MKHSNTNPASPGAHARARTLVLCVAAFAAGVGVGAAVRHAGAPSGPPPVAAPAPSPRAPVSAASAAQAEAEAEVQRGAQLLAEGRSGDALLALERAAALDPTDPRPHHGLGKLHQQVLLQEKAEEAYRAALTRDPTFRPSQEALVMILYEKGAHEEALRWLAQLETATPGEPFVWGEIAINELALGKTASAVSRLERYRAARPDDAWGRTHLARAYAASGRPREAEEEYRRALALDRGFSAAYHGLGQLLVGEGRESEAAPFLERYRKLRQLTTEEHQLKMALQRNPDDLNALVGLARIQFLRGRREDCRKYLERARPLAPADPRLAELEGMLRRLPGPGE